MPTPRKGESEKSFVARCIPQVIREGTAKDGSQANAVCHSMYREHQKKQRGDELDFFSSGVCLLDFFDSYAEWQQYEAQNRRPPSEVQTLIFDKKIFPTRDSAKSWAKEHDFRSDTVRETTNSWRLRQRPVEDFRQGSFRIIDMRRGIRSVIGRLK